MAIQPPPQAPPVFTHSPADLSSKTEQLIACNKELVDNIVKNVSVEKAEFSTVLLPFVQGRSVMSLDMNIIGFLRSVTSDAKVREASASAEKKVSDYTTESSMREDLYLLVEAIYRKQKKDPALDAESRFLLEKEYKAYMRMGFGLPPAKRSRLQEIKKRLPELYIAFSKNLGKKKEGIWFTLEELSGVPDDLLETLEKGQQSSENEGKMKLTFKPTELRTAQKYCTVAETRKKLENLVLLQEAIPMRAEAARMLGYADHATFVLEDRMAQTPKIVNDFLDDLRKRLANGAQNELEKLKELKRNEPGCVDPDRYYIWEHSYYSTLMLERDFQLDQRMVSEYFPLQTCLARMLNIFEELFGLSFVKIDGNDRDAISKTGRGDDIVWHPDVQLFAVWNDANEPNDFAFVGYLYCDLHPREGKFGGAANYTLQQGFATDNGSGRHYPATALVCNFSEPTARKPSLLKHGEVVTMFHELGHGIHNLVSQTKYGRLHGTNTTRDFVEAPSQMLESWCWISSQIQALSKHWSYLSPEYEKSYMDSVPNAAATRPEEKMPEAMVQAIIRTRFVNDALLNLRMLHYSIFDMAIHQPKSHEEALNMDLSKMFNKLRHDVCMLDDLGDADDYHWAHGAAIFSHIMGGYDVGLYGYLTSQVYATDMFRTVFSKDPMNKEAGRRYREIVLKPGGSREPMDLLKEFLGREPSNEAFYEQLGIA
ncbi:hypothetical protein LLEC1_07866 [Akanthomyces lecanii]|uniref:Peptidase M3A/M3B catalytic domain-containing protein n=1 Tax=Cordyceps confragosa TaxID=2714763 RepID=A0A179IBK0_CORDF|nr:hypothetical protein LLEC1_07866 [Akanthomyces lecanii]